MKRISIIGSGGAGKSTLAAKLGQILDIPVYHLDSLFWKPGWVETERVEWALMQEAICRESSWIIDGNYGGTMDVRFAASDTVIFLDINRYLCLYRAVKRFITYHGKTRPDMGEGCNEQLNFHFLKWIYNYPIEKRPKILNQLSSLDCKVLHLRSPKEVEAFLGAPHAFENS